MRLRLSVGTRDGTPDDVAVEIDPDAPLADLIVALAPAAGVAPSQVRALATPRGVIEVGGDRPLRSSGVRDGDHLDLLEAAEASPTRSAAALELVAVGGPSVGVRIPLGPGRCVIGRGEGADVVVNDRAMSRRHMVFDVDGATVTVADAGSSNGTYVQGEAVRKPQPLAAGETIEAGQTRFEIHRPLNGDAPAGDSELRTRFNRPPRVATPLQPTAPVLPAAPAAREPNPLPLGAMAIPVVVGGVMVAVTGNLLLLSFMLLTPSMVLYNHFEGRRSAGRSRRRDDASYQQQLAAAVAELHELRSRDEQQRRAAAPDVAEIQRRAFELVPGLWERRLDDDDALTLRIGTADLPSTINPPPPPDGGDPGPGVLTATLAAVPVTVPVRTGVLGLAGRDTEVDGIARWLVAQAAVLHSPAELRIAAALDGGRVAAWDWLKWLPHVDPAGLVIGPAASRTLLEDLAEQARPTLVVIDGALGVEPGLAGRAAAAGGSAVVWLGRDQPRLPGTCTQVAVLDQQLAHLTLTDVRAGTVVESVTAEQLDAAQAEELARRLTAVEDAGAARAMGAIPSRLSLFDLLGLPEPTPTTLAGRWQANRDHLRAAIGRSADGPFEIDAGAVDGLRMVLAGMPGTGKSELLLSLIGSLAATHGPDRVTFLLVDYKGGAAFRDCMGLPHTVGLLTDLDEHLAERCRISLVAELRRREALLAEQGAKNLRALVRRNAAAAPPALLIVVDEFATLAREVPSFVGAVLDVAQRGRSLGMHLVLATQRPRGAIDDTLRANTNLRIAMRVADPAESQDVIGASDAAGILPRHSRTRDRPLGPQRRRLPRADAVPGRLRRWARRRTEPAGRAAPDRQGRAALASAVDIGLRPPPIWSGWSWQRERRQSSRRSTRPRRPGFRPCRCGSPCRAASATCPDGGAARASRRAGQPAPPAALARPGDRRLGARVRRDG